jgi:hypothetical protein
MCKEMPVIPVNRLADRKRIIRKNVLLHSCESAAGDTVHACFGAKKNGGNKSEALNICRL